MQRCHDDFEGGLVLELRVRIDRDAAAIVDDRQIAVTGIADVDPRGVAGHRLVHGIVEHFGEKVMQRLLVGAANIHAGAAAHRLKAFQHLDVGRRIALLAAQSGGCRVLRLRRHRQIVEEIVGLCGFGHWRSRIVSWVEYRPKGVTGNPSLSTGIEALSWSYAGTRHHRQPPVLGPDQRRVLGDRDCRGLEFRGRRRRLYRIG